MNDEVGIPIITLSQFPSFKRPRLKIATIINILNCMPLTKAEG